MPSGACVIRREGVRGVTWYVKYRDATGRQVKERLDPRQGPWDERKAERELGARLATVKRERWTKPTRETFAEFVAEWRTVYLPSRNLKRSTLVDYENTLDRHALPILGDVPLDAIGPQHLDAYIAKKSVEGLSAKTITNHLATLNVVFKVAKRWRRVRTNPVEEVERPRAAMPDTAILTEGEVSRLLVAYRQLEVGADEPDVPWWPLARRMTLVVLGTALRRGELLALRWQDVDLIERRLHVRRSWVRNEMTTPKSKASRRTVPFGVKTAAALEDQLEASRYRGLDELVFGHPSLGTPIDPAELTRSYVKPALRKAGITKRIQPWHGLRHTALTNDAAVGNPNAYVQAKAGHSQFSITERYIHAAQTVFPGAVDRSEARLFRGVSRE
jgi:integrase